MASDPRWRENQKVSVAARSSSNALVPALAAIVETGHWREFVHPMQGLKQYATFAAYCDDFLGLSAQAVETLLDKSQHKADARTVRRLIREGIEPAAKHGEIGNGRGSGTTSTTEGDRDATYIVARLKRDHPDLAQQVIDGQISPNKAAIQAGIRKPYIRVRADDAHLAVAALLKHYTPIQLLAALNREETQ